MDSGRYTANSVGASPVVYLSVNVYRAADGWYLVTRVMRTGGKTPRTIRLVDQRIVAPTDASLSQAAGKAAEALQQIAEDGIIQ